MLDNAIPGALIKTVFKQEKGHCGAKLITAELNDPANDLSRTPVNHKRCPDHEVTKTLRLHEETPGQHHRVKSEEARDP